jgi:hypothetical protein
LRVACMLCVKCASGQRQIGWQEAGYGEEEEEAKVRFRCGSRAARADRLLQRSTSESVRVGTPRVWKVWSTRKYLEGGLVDVPRVLLHIHSQVWRYGEVAPPTDDDA